MLYQWWAGDAGPIEAGSALVGKDAPAAFPFVPTGTFVKRIHAARDAGRWKETLAGSDVQGRYATYQNGELFERGFYALGKRHQFIIWAPTGPCAGVGNGVYRWYLARASPTRRLLGFAIIRDACGVSGPGGTS